MESGSAECTEDTASAIGEGLSATSTTLTYCATAAAASGASAGSLKAVDISQ